MNTIKNRKRPDKYVNLGPVTWTVTPNTYNYWSTGILEPFERTVAITTFFVDPDQTATTDSCEVKNKLDHRIKVTIEKA